MTALVASDFFSALDANHCDENKKLIFIEENENSDCSFMIASFIWRARQNENAEIIFLTCHNSVQHYQYLFNKWGPVLRNTSCQTNITNLRLMDFLETNDSLNISSLLTNIREKCEILRDTKTYLVVDDLSYLIILSSLHECVHFSRQLTKLLVDYKLLKIVVCSHVTPADKNLTLISKFFHHISNFVLSVMPLKSGFSNEVTGHMKITAKHKLKQTTNLYNFKLDDKKFTLNPYVI